MKKTTLLVSILLSIFILLPSGVFAVWTIETLDSVGTVGSSTSIAIDSLGKMHISYYDTTNADLKYATNVSGSWVTTTVDSSTGAVGQYTSIAIDSSDKVHISYYDSDFNYDLKYATNASGSWVTTIVDSTGGSYTSIAIDSSDKVHISYTANAGLKYATNASGSWVTTTVDSTINGKEYTSIAIDSLDNMHISYYHEGTLKYATNASGSWVAATVDTGYVGGYTSLAIDSSDKVHISYYDFYYTNLKYATNASGSWVTTTLDSTGTVGSSTSIAIDSLGKMHISYYDTTNADLKYATTNPTPDVDNDTDGYTENQGDCDDTNPVINPLTFWYQDSDGDGYGNPAVSLQQCAQPAGYVLNNTDNNDDPNVEWTLKTVDSTVMAFDTSIAIDSSGKVHISYYDDVDENLKYATNASGSWVITTVDSTGSVGRYTSIAIDSSGEVHISYYDLTNYGLKYATNASGSWVITTVDSTGSVGEYTSIAIDSFGKVHISYYDSYYNADLKYATNASGSWVTTIVDSSYGDVGQYTSIAIDSFGKVHISYYDTYYNDLKYATNASGSWVTTIVDSTGYVGAWTSIAIDSSGKMHISYYDATNYGLKYATNASGSWVNTTVDSTGSVGRYTSIAIDSLDNMHISYYDATNDDLKYATNASGSWVNTTVDSAGSVGWNTSIAIESSGRVHVSYLKYVYFYNWDLKYATNPAFAVDNDADGYTENQGDCDDTTSAINPGASETFGNTIDDDCNAATPDYNVAPTADSGGPYTGTEGVAITLNGSGSSDPNNNIATYEWDIDNNGTYDYSSASPTQNHTYAQQGIYTVKLRVTDNLGATSEATTTSVISDSSPSAGFTGNPASGRAPLTVSFTNSSTGNDQPLTYEWDFDNNGTVDSTLLSPSHEYAGTGTYSVKLTVTDSDGSTNVLTRTNYITASSCLSPVKVIGAVNSYYTSLQPAYNDSSEGDDIHFQDDSFNENLIFNSSKAITLRGGYDCDFNATTNKTVINGNVTISNGVVTMENIIIQ